VYFLCCMYQVYECVVLFLYMSGQFVFDTDAPVEHNYTIVESLCKVYGFILKLNHLHLIIS
jgi:hypothetical protein